MPGFDLRAVAEAALAFRRARHWEVFHTPANLAKGLAIEAAELLELFLWTRGPDEERARAAEIKERLADEIADVVIFAIYLCHDTGIDLTKAVRKKLRQNAKKYPVGKARGRSTKYTEL